MAAPLAATILADLGAEVVKVERPGGDPMRADPPAFAAWNRGKRTVELDLTTESGRRELGALLDRADLLIENLRPGSLERHLDRRRRRAGERAVTGLRRGRPRLVTCSISGWGSSGPSRDEPGWEPLVQARAGMQQGLFTGDDAIWQPFPVGSVAAALLAVLGAGAALVKRESTGYGQHVETSLLDGLLFLNAAPIFHRPGHRPRVSRQKNSVVLRPYETADGRSVMVNLSGTERWRELCRLLGIDDGGLDYGTPEGLSRLSDKEWNRAKLAEVTAAFASRTADEWEAALLESPAAVAKCNTLAEWLDSEQARANDAGGRDGRPRAGAGAVAGPARADRGRARRAEARPPARRRAGGARWAPHRRPVQLLGRAPGVAPAGRARGRRGEGGAAGRRGRVPDDAGPAQHLRRRQSVQAGAGARPQGTDRPGPAARPGGRVRRRGRERGGRRVGAARARRGGAAGGQPGAGLRPGQGLRLGRAAGHPALVRLRGAGGDGDGDDPGRRADPGGGQRGGQRLRDGAAPGGRDRVRPAGTGPWGAR